MSVYEYIGFFGMLLTVLSLCGIMDLLPFRFYKNNFLSFTLWFSVVSILSFLLAASGSTLPAVYLLLTLAPLGLLIFGLVGLNRKKNKEPFFEYVTLKDNEYSFTDPSKYPLDAFFIHAKQVAVMKDDTLIAFRGNAPAVPAPVLLYGIYRQDAECFVCFSCTYLSKQKKTFPRFCEKARSVILLFSALILPFTAISAINAEVLADFENLSFLSVWLIGGIWLFGILERLLKGTRDMFTRILRAGMLFFFIACALLLLPLLVFIIL